MTNAKSLGSKFRTFILNTCGDNHIFWTLFKFFFIFYGGILFGGIFVSYVLSPTPDFKYVTDSFLNMMEEVQKEEQINVFSRRVGVIRPIKRSFFFNGFISKSRAVIITNYVAKWKANQKWIGTGSDRYLSDLAGKKKKIVRISTNKIFGKTSKYEKMTIRNFLMNYKTSPYYLNRFHLNGGFLNDIPKQLAIASTLGVPKYRTLSIGSGGQLIPLHFGLYEIFICQLSGERTYTLYTPLQVKYLYPKKKYESSIEIPSKADLRKYPLFKKAKPLIVTLKPGEILYIPAHYWFSVELGTSSDKNMAVRYEYRPHAARFSKVMKTIAKSENGHLKSLKENQ